MASSFPPVSLAYTPARSGINSDITALAGLTTALSLPQGGTGAGTASGVRTNLGLDGYVFRNRLRNPSFVINQRSVSGTVTLAAGAYGHDGAKGGASGCTYTFSASGLDTTITITAGSLILPIEAALIEGGSYSLSQAGTAQARIWQGTGSSGSGAYAVAGSIVTGLTAAMQTNVEFLTGTVLRPQFEPGGLVTSFERRPLGIERLMCHRHYRTSYDPGTSPGSAPGNGGCVGNAIAVGGGSVVDMGFGTPMGGAPTVTIYDGTGTSGKVSYYSSAWNGSGSITVLIPRAERFFLQTNISGAVQINFNWTASWEI